MKNLNKAFPICNVAQAANVTRWHSVRCLRHPSIAEHSYLVTVFAQYLADAIDPDMSEIEQLRLMQRSLWHDMPEVKTGDMATPLKRYLEKQFNGHSPIETLERKICKPYGQIAAATDGTHLAIICKLADIMDAIYFINNEGMNVQAKKIFRERKSAFTKYVNKGFKEFPKYNWIAAEELLNDLLSGEPDRLDFEEIFDLEVAEGLSVTEEMPKIDK